MGDFDFEIVPDHKAPAPDAKHRMLLADYAILLWLQHAMDAELHGCGRGQLLDASWTSPRARPNCGGGCRRRSTRCPRRTRCAARPSTT